MTDQSSAWTDARRARQAVLIRNWRPWENATGPRTPEGKAVSSRNAAAKRGSVRTQLNAIAAEMKSVQRMIKRATAKRK